MADIPKFNSDEEAAEWFDTHDTADYMDSMEEVTDQIPVIRTIFPTRPVDVRLRSDYFEAIQKMAEKQGIPYQMLVQQWLMEKVHEEAPDSLAV
jgi:predicted DNA binding CopG/RHH family protein